jgi:hypothetical protein
MTAVEVPKDVNTQQVDALAALVDDEFIARLAGQARAQACPWSVPVGCCSS